MSEGSNSRSQKNGMNRAGRRSRVGMFARRSQSQTQAQSRVSRHDVYTNTILDSMTKEQKERMKRQEELEEKQRREKNNHIVYDGGYVSEDEEEENRIFEERMKELKRIYGSSLPYTTMEYMAIRGITNYANTHFYSKDTENGIIDDKEEDNISEPYSEEEEYIDEDTDEEDEEIDKGKNSKRTNE